MLHFKPAFSHSSFSFIKRVISSSSLSAISVLLSAYLRLLIFLLIILIPACDSFSLAFHMIYSAYACKLNKQGDNKQPCHTPFPILNQSVPYLVNHRQVSQETGKVFGYSHLFKNFPHFAVIHIVKGFSVVNPNKQNKQLKRRNLSQYCRNSKREREYYGSTNLTT